MSELLETGFAPATAPRPKLWKRVVLVVLGVLLLVAAIVGVKVLLIRKQMAAMKPPAPPIVSAAPARFQAWQDRIDTVGNVRAWRGTDLSTEVAGIVRAVRFRSGESVAAGAALFELNADAERAQLHALEAAADLAQTALARDREQLAASAVSQATIDADEADLKSKRALVEQQRAVLEKKTIRAPFAGRAGITTVNPGLYLNTGDKVVSLQSIDSVYVDFNVAQRELAKVQPGAVVEVRVDAWPQRVFKGKVNAINSALDAGTRNVMVEATIANPQHALLPGMFAKVGLYVGKEERRLTLPQSAVTFNPYGATVFVADAAKAQSAGPDGGKPAGGAAAGAAAEGAKDVTAKPGAYVARQVFVTTGPTRGDQIAILKGVQEGEVVVTSGQLKLKNGAPLTVDNTVTPADDAQPAPQEQ